MLYFCINLKLKKIKTIKSLAIVAAVIILTSCSTTTKFPVSSVTPAAVITAVKKTDKNNNFKINVKAKHLSSPDRISPPKNVFVVWAVTSDNGIKNLGQLTNKNAKTANLKATTAFTVLQIFITAEDQGNVSYPEGVEISRTIFNN